MTRRTSRRSLPGEARLGRRDFGRWSLAAAVLLAGCAPARHGADSPPTTAAPSPAPPRGDAAPIAKTDAAAFVGDYRTGDFSQWWVQCRGYNVDGRDFPGTYSATIVADPSHGEAARFEVRTGDVPPFGGGERSEVSSDQTVATDGQEAWYGFSTMFDPSFPTNHADLGWGLTNQWHGDSNAGSPPINWSTSFRNGEWTLIADRQSFPGGYLGQVALFSTPLAVGTWHDVRMQVRWSPSDDDGFVRLWHNGVRQTFADGSQTYRGRTLVPGGSPSFVYYKEGYYRQNGIGPTGVVYHSGFRCAPTEAGI